MMMRIALLHLVALVALLAVDAPGAAAPAGRPDDGRPVAIAVDQAPADAAAVRPLDDPLAPPAGRAPPFPLFDGVPKVFLCCGGHRFVQNGRMKPKLVGLVERWYRDRGAASPITWVVPPEAQHPSEHGPAAWNAALTPFIAKAKAEAKDQPLVVLCDWSMAFLEWRSDGTPKRTGKGPAAEAKPPGAASLAAGADLLAAFAGGLRTAGADAVLLSTYPGRGGSFARGDRYRLGALRATTTGYDWWPFLEYERRRPGGVIWGPNGYAVNKDRPWLWTEDGDHWKDSAVFAHSWLVHLLRLDGRPVPTWAQDGFAAALRGEPVDVR